MRKNKKANRGMPEEMDAQSGDSEFREDTFGSNRSLSLAARWPSKLLSNLRFSLTLRVAIHYAGQLLRTTLFVFFVFTVAFFLAQAPTVVNSMDQLAEMEPLAGREYSTEQLSSMPMERAYYVEEPISSDWDGIVQKVSLAFSEFRLKDHPKALIYLDTLGGGLVAVFPLDYVLQVYTILFWTFLCCDLYRVWFFLRKRNGLNKRVLKPIVDITEAAAALSANNLSDRISIEGTKNELKDLATVINLMLDRIERSYNSQKQFVSDASHELRTPIAVIQGYVNLLERWGKTDKAVLDEGITAISQETTAMKELVERLLFLARHDKKTLMLEMEYFDPTEVMSSIYRDAQLISPNHHFELKLKQSVMINGDKGMIKQLMRILLDNAIKYTPAQGCITLGMDREREFCVLSVTDSGAGISAQELPRIFDRFYRSDKARKAQSSGHGLGLSIARIIVVAHGGKLNVRSKEGVGTKFSVKLPISQEERY